MQKLLVYLDQWFLTGCMVHPRVNEIFATENERKGVNEFYVAKFFGALVFLLSPNTYQQS